MENWDAPDFQLINFAIHVADTELECPGIVTSVREHDSPHWLHALLEWSGLNELVCFRNLVICCSTQLLLKNNMYLVKKLYYIITLLQDTCDIIFVKEYKIFQ